MAEELPLAEVRAVVSAQRRAKAYTVTWMLDPQDIKVMNAFLDGPSGEKLVVLSIRPLPADWESGPVDPSQGEESELDQTARLNSAWEALVEQMRTDA